MLLFGQQRYSIVEYFEKNRIALKHLLLKNWDPSFETMPYPPATGQYAIYTQQELVDYVNFAMYQVLLPSKDSNTNYQYITDQKCTDLKMLLPDAHGNWNMMVRSNWASEQ